MGTTVEKLALLKANKESIRDAITEKIGEDAGEVMSTYAEKIRGIESTPKYYRTTILLDQTITDPATMITKVYDDGGIDMIRANSHRYVCKLVDGVLEAKQLQDANGTLYLDGSTANLTGGEGDVFMKLPQFYYRGTEQEADKWLIDFVYGAMPSDDYNYWDGKDFIGVYEGYVANNGVYSYSGVASRAGASQANFKLYASSRGAGYSLIKWKHHSIMAFLFFAKYLNTNSQSVCGHGTNSNTKATGQTNLLGMEDTVAGVNGDSQSINYWGLENWWGNKSEFIDDATLLNGVFTAEGVSISVLDFGSAYPKKMYIGNGLHPICTSAGASDSTGFCDLYILTSSTTPKVAYRSGATNSTGCGVVFAVIADTNSYTNSLVGTRLAYRGEYEEFDGVFSTGYQMSPFTSDGHQYFDTGFKHNQDTRVVMHVKASGTPKSNAFFFDGPSGASTRKGVFYSTSADTIAVDYKTQDTRQTYSNVSIEDELRIDYNKNSCNINDEIKGFTEATFQSASNLTLLASNLSNSPTAPIAATLYSCQIYDNGTLIRDYVPCIRKSDGVSGLWDKINNTFNTPNTIA